MQEADVLCRSDITYSIHPLDGYFIHDVIVDGVSAGDVDSVFFKMSSSPTQ